MWRNGVYMNKKSFLGVAYYPEAWDRSQIDEDLDGMQEHGISCVRIAEFAWKTMEPTEGNFDFSLFREVVDKCRKRGMMVIMGTPGATPPLWLSHKYPDVYGKRYNGADRFHGSRQDCCYNHEKYLELATRITEKMAEEFANDENIIGWQIDNEIFSSKDYVFCVCPRCEAAYKKWMHKKFNGDTAKYNREVGTNIFSSAIDSFDDLHRPYDQWIHPAHKALYREFQLACSASYVKMQYDAIKKHTDKPVGTDMMPILHALSYDDMAGMLDVIQFNEYQFDEFAVHNEFWSNFLYNKKKKPYWLTETAPCWNGSEISNYMRHKGFIDMNAWMNISGGAENVNYWLWRTHYAGHELMHGSVVESNGRARHIKNEVIKLSHDIEKCSDVITKTAPEGSGLTVIFSELAERMFTFQSLYNGFRYVNSVVDDYLALSRERLRPSVVSECADISSEKVVYTPYLLAMKDDFSKKLLDFVREGGVWVTTALTDIRNACGAKFIKAATSVLESAADITIDFTIPAYKAGVPEARGYDATAEDGTVYTCRDIVYDAITPGKTAVSLAKYTDEEYLAGYSAITETKYGKGKIVVLGFIPTKETLLSVVGRVCREASIVPFVKADENITVVKRSGEFDAIIAVEHEYMEGEITLPFDATEVISDTEYKAGDVLKMKKYGVAVLKKAK